MSRSIDFHTALAQEVAKHATQEMAADALGLSPQYLSDLMTGKREPGPKVLKALGLERETIYHRKGKG